PSGHLSPFRFQLRFNDLARSLLDQTVLRGELVLLGELRDDEIPLPLTLKREKRGAGKENKTCSEGDTGRKPETSHLFFPPGSKLQECFGTENGYDGETDHGENEPHLRCAEFV